GDSRIFSHSSNIDSSALRLANSSLDTFKVSFASSPVSLRGLPFAIKLHHLFRLSYYALIYGKNDCLPRYSIGLRYVVICCFLMRICSAKYLLKTGKMKRKLRTVF